MDTIPILPARPMTEADRLERRARLLAEAVYYQRISALHAEFAVVMMDYHDPASWDYPADQIKQWQQFAATTNRMARRMLFAIVGD
jgi:hypothetical protein